MRTPFAGRRPPRQGRTNRDARRPRSATLQSRTPIGGRNSMLAIALLIAAPAESPEARLRHLESMAAAWAPAPSPDGARVAFLTTLFGTPQAVSTAVEGGYP